ncbi:MAG TPA: TIM barrel protein, partial [Actinophytocola sp.]|nr:TIM barrel protein [Actinophytocola sp.]
MVVPGLVSVTFRRHSVVEVVGLVVSTGLSAVEWGADVHVPTVAAAREAAARCAAAGVAIAAYGSYYRAGESADFADVLRTALALGAPRIRIWASRHGSAQEPDRTAVVADIAAVTTQAASEGIEICLEHHANTLTDTVESTVDLLRAVPAA